VAGHTDKPFVDALYAHRPDTLRLYRPQHAIIAASVIFRLSSISLSAVVCSAFVHPPRPPPRFSDYCAVAMLFRH